VSSRRIWTVTTVDDLTGIVYVVNVATHFPDVVSSLRHQPNVDATVIVSINQHDTSVGFLPLPLWKLVVDPIKHKPIERLECYPIFGLDHGQNVSIDIVYHTARVEHSNLIHRGGL